MVQWLKLALSNGPNRVGVCHPLTWGRKQIQFPNVVFFRIPTMDKVQKPSNPGTFSVSQTTGRRMLKWLIKKWKGCEGRRRGLTEALSRHSSGVAEVNNKKICQIVGVRPRFKLGTSRIQTGIASAWTSILGVMPIFRCIPSEIIAKCQETEFIRQDITCIADLPLRLNGGGITRKALCVGGSVHMKHHTGLPYTEWS
jgi:hypothetical protein